MEAAPATLEASHQLMFAPIGDRWHVHYHGPAASVSLQVAHSFPGCYVSHWNPTGFVWKHLLANG